MQEPRRVRVLAFAGSLRNGSYNKALVRAAQREAPPDMVVDPYDVADIPPYNYDLEVQGDPEPVRQLKRAVGGADGLLVATPEYNHSVSGVTKNVIDWISRPAGRSVLHNLPVAVMGASQGQWGTARAQVVLRQSFAFTNSFAMPQPQVLVARAGDKFDEAGNLTDEQTREVLRHFLEAFADWIRLFQGRGADAAPGPGSRA